MNILDYKELLPKFQESVPVSITAICRAVGIRVYRVSEWHDRISGKIQRDPSRGGKSGFAIFVNNDHPLTRQRFTIAHEIAHFVCHRSLIGDGVAHDALYRSGLSSAVEAEANRLAADTLMPRHLVEAEMEKGAASVEELAKRFRVSPCAMSIRFGGPGRMTETEESALS